jgi:hypothetical protein
MAAFPPCDHLAVSGARWFKGKGLRCLSKSIEMFATAAEMCCASGARYMIENPVSTISTYWRKPDYSFHPWHFHNYHKADNYCKKTMLWVGGGFVMPDKITNRPDHIRDYIHSMPPSKNRKYLRSLTPKGFSIAVYESNS